MSFDNDFGKDIVKLIKVLKKIMKQYPPYDKMPMPDIDKMLSSPDQGMQLNVFIFPFLALSPEELEEIEEALDPSVPEGESRSEEIRYHLSPSDLDFLRRHGIRF